MSVVVEYSVVGMPQVQALFAQFHGQPLQNRMRRALRAGLRVVTFALRAEGRGRADLPHKFSKTRTRAHRNPLGVSVSPQSPLSTIYEHGASQHTITPKAKGVMAGKAGEHARGAAFFAHGAVTHPGMAARPFVGPVFDRSQRAAETAFTSTLFAGLG